MKPPVRATHYFVDGFGITLWSPSSGNLRSMSPKWSIGAARRPTTVSNGGLLGADGWDLDGTKALVRPKLFASLKPSASSMFLRRSGKSCASSSLMCWERLDHSFLSVGTKSGVPAFKFWNVLRSSLTYLTVSIHRHRRISSSK